MVIKWKKMCEKACDKVLKRLLLWVLLLASLIIVFLGVAVATGEGAGPDAFSCFGVDHYVDSVLHAKDVKAAFDEVRDKCIASPHKYFHSDQWKFQGVYEFREEGADHFHKTNIPDEAYRAFAKELTEASIQEEANRDAEEEMTEDEKEYYRYQKTEEHAFYLERVDELKKDKADWYFNNNISCYYKWDGTSFFPYGEKGCEAGLELLRAVGEKERITIGFTEKMLQAGEQRFGEIVKNLYAGCAAMAGGLLVMFAILSILVTDVYQNRRGRRHCDVMAAYAVLMLCFLPGHIAGRIRCYQYGTGLSDATKETIVAIEIWVVLIAAVHIACVLVRYLRHAKERRVRGGNRDTWFFYRFFMNVKRRVTGETYYGLGIEGCNRKRFWFTLILSGAVVLSGFVAAAGAFFLLSEYITMGIMENEDWLTGFFMLIIVEAVVLGGIWKIYYLGSKKIFGQYRQLMGQVDEICDGRFQTHSMLSDTSVLVGESRKMSMLGCQMQEHVQKQIQAEKMKMDLITNVSHDLKTPLTSLISYIDLLSKEDLPPTASDYVKVLERKSGHLRKMIADVFDLAKASSGNLEVKKERVDLNRLLIQTLGDMGSEIEKASVKIVTDISETAGILKSDGEKLYRVLQNILENALKYSMPHTRVFVTLAVEKQEAVIRIKNVAAYEMNFTAEEVMGRFFRGDKARSTEGSGLGLAIAKEFSELCGGILSLDISGDVFTVELRFVCEDVIVP